MIALVIVGGLILAYSIIGPGKMFGMKRRPVGETLMERIDNGYQFRDVTYTTMQDYIGDPDIRNNSYFNKPGSFIAQDLGVYGTFRRFFQFQPGNSEIVQVHSNPENLII